MRLLWIGSSFCGGVNQATMIIICQQSNWSFDFVYLYYSEKKNSSFIFCYDMAISPPNALNVMPQVNECVNDLRAAVSLYSTKARGDDPSISQLLGLSVKICMRCRYRLLKFVLLHIVLVSFVLHLCCGIVYCAFVKYFLCQFNPYL